MQAQVSLEEFLKEIERIYSKINIYMLNLKKKMRLILASQVNSKEALIILQRENAWWKNRNRHEDFYFAPAKQKSFNWLFLDDVDINRIKEFEAYIVQTSLLKQQAYIKLSKEIKEEEYKEIAKEAVKTFKADKAVIDAYHLRRLPSFLNNKYTPPYLITWYYQKGKAFEIQAHAPPHNRKRVLLPSQTQNQKGGRVLERRKRRKSWEEFYKPTAPSFSEADFAYSCYLLKLGYTAEEVKEILRQESPDLKQRHRNVEDYLNRTLKAALRRIYV